MDLLTYSKFVFALLFVIGLIALLAYGARKLGLVPKVTLKSGKSKDRRLNIVEILPVDAKRRLLLIRRDDTEHLIMIGSERDLVIEQNITKKDS